MATHGRGRARRPKTSEVIGLLRVYPEEIEADIARHYPGRDIGQFWRGELSARALSVLIRHLPEDSALVKAERGTPWPELLYMLANIADTVTYHRADYANVHGGQSRPTPVTRPPTAEDEEQRDQAREIHDALGHMMRGHLVVDAPADGRHYEPDVETV